MFLYTDDYTEYIKMLDVKITDCLCKQVMTLNTKKAQEVYMEAQKVGNQKVIWGYDQNLSAYPAKNREAQIMSIQRMVFDLFNRAIRVVIDKTGVLWIDNLHTAIKDVIVYGDDHKLIDSNVYIVDMRNDIPKVVDIDGSVSDSVFDITNAVACSVKRVKYITPELYKIKYTIGEFIADNKITRESLTLDEKKYKKYTDRYKNELR